MIRADDKMSGNIQSLFTSNEIKINDAHKSRPTKHSCCNCGENKRENEHDIQGYSKRSECLVLIFKRIIGKKHTSKTDFTCELDICY